MTASEGGFLVKTPRLGYLMDRQWIALGGSVVRAMLIT
jgi:hypothetical protein